LLFVFLLDVNGSHASFTSLKIILNFIMQRNGFGKIAEVKKDPFATAFIQYKTKALFLVKDLNMAKWRLIRPGRRSYLYLDIICIKDFFYLGSGGLPDRLPFSST